MFSDLGSRHPALLYFAATVLLSAVRVGAVPPLTLIWYAVSCATQRPKIGHPWTPPSSTPCYRAATARRPGSFVNGQCPRAEAHPTGLLSCSKLPLIAGFHN